MERSSRRVSGWTRTPNEKLNEVESEEHFGFDSNIFLWFEKVDFFHEMGEKNGSIQMWWNVKFFP